MRTGWVWLLLICVAGGAHGGALGADGANTTAPAATAASAAATETTAAASTTTVAPTPAPADTVAAETTAPASTAAPAVPDTSAAPNTSAAGDGGDVLLVVDTKDNAALQDVILWLGLVVLAALG